MCALRLWKSEGSGYRFSYRKNKAMQDGIQLSEALAGNGAAIFRHACGMGVSKRRISSRYLSGRTRAWLEAPAPANSFGERQPQGRKPSEPARLRFVLRPRPGTATPCCHGALTRCVVSRLSSITARLSRQTVAMRARAAMANSRKTRR
jgi:hypothetical protein